MHARMREKKERKNAPARFFSIPFPIPIFIIRARKFFGRRSKRRKRDWTVFFLIGQRIHYTPLPTAPFFGTDPRDEPKINLLIARMPAPNPSSGHVTNECNEPTKCQRKTRFARSISSPQRPRRTTRTRNSKILVDPKEISTLTSIFLLSKQAVSQKENERKKERERDKIDNHVH